MFRILCSNLGYGRNIDGTLGQHLGRGYRYFYTPKSSQVETLAFLRQRMDELQPDLSCFLEINQGSFGNGFFNQMKPLCGPDICHFEADNKYGFAALTGKSSVPVGKSNGFAASMPVQYKRHFLDYGLKRLVYEIIFEDRLSVFLVHCSLRPWVRHKQFAQLAQWVNARPGPVMLLGDFNNLLGPHELKPLLESGQFHLINDLFVPTFRLGNWQACIDLCLASPSIAGRIRMDVLDQPCSDHQILLIDLDI